MTSKPVFAALLSFALLVSLGSCRHQQAAASGPIVNRALDLTLDSLPSAFKVKTNKGDQFVLETTDPSLPGTVTFSVSKPGLGGVNLVAAVKDRKAAFEAAKDGKYLGNQELMTPLGSAFTARGRYTDAQGQKIEEIWVYLLHPKGDRLLSIDYHYPVGDYARQRAQEILDLLGDIHAPAKKNVPPRPQPSSNP